jgi:phosphoglycolate phosphatase
MKKLLIFDMDGTLVDSSDVIANSINHIRKHIGLETMSKETILTNINDPKINGNNFFYNDTYFDDEMTQKFNKYYNENCIKDLKLFDGVDSLLKDLQKDYHLVIATNTPTSLAKKMLQYLQVSHYFQLIVGSDMVQKPKPHPDMLLYILKNMNIQQKETLFIGDSKKDKLTANKANIDFIFINWDTISPQQLLEQIKKTIENIKS